MKGLYFEFLEMRCSVVDYIDLQVMLQKVQIVLHPFFAFRLELFEGIKLNFVLPCSNVLSFDVVLVRELFEPEG